MEDMAKQLHNAKREKYDEFYTLRSDIDKELVHYKAHFRDKVVLCNCDDPRVSNFFKYFASMFRPLGLKRLIATCYKCQDINIFSDNSSETAVYIDYYGEEQGSRNWYEGELEFKTLEGDGDFRSPECIELLKEADIVVTNPPFSLFREYIAQLIKYDKKFLIIGNQNAITYKEIFPLIRDNKVWLGCRNGDMAFVVPESTEPRATRFWIDESGVKYRSLGNICWFTNLEHRRRNEELILTDRYDPERYPKYDNYDAIEVGQVLDIPEDYEGEMGVPITFLDKYNPNQFEILGATESEGIGFSNGLWHADSKVAQPLVAGVRKYKRLFIRYRKEFLERKRAEEAEFNNKYR